MKLSEKQLLVAFGTNQRFGENSPAELIRQAAGIVAAELDAEITLSRLYQTPCFPVGAGPDYVNAAAMLTLRQPIPAPITLQKLHKVEERFGRKRSTRWASRTLDIDLLAMGGLILPDRATQNLWRNLPLADQARLAPEELILPHPRLQDRAFVLVPLADVAPDWRHPVLEMTTAQLLAGLPTAARDEVVALASSACD